MSYEKVAGSSSSSSPFVALKIMETDLNPPKTGFQNIGKMTI
jgi:hypothetical protein